MLLYEINSASGAIANRMIYAVSAEDKETFDGLWNYAKSQLNASGLMSWLIGADNKPLDTSSAADADLDIAYALVAADKTWGGYKDDATAMINNILAFDVEPQTFVLKG